MKAASEGESESNFVVVNVQNDVRFHHGAEEQFDDHGIDPAGENILSQVFHKRI